MKRPWWNIRSILFVALLLSASHTAGARNEGNLYDLFEDKTTRFIVSDIVDSANLKKSDAIDLKERFETALTERRSLTFERAAGAAEADILVECHITEFEWLKEDPVDKITGMTGVALDAMMIENYARLNVDVAVKEARTGEVLWSRSLKATVTEESMTEEESIPKVLDGIIKVFTREALSKKRSRAGQDRRRGPASASSR